MVIAFEGSKRIAVGDLKDVALEAKAAADGGGAVLIFDDETSEVVELDFRGTPHDVLQRLAPPPEPPRAPGRPRLGVVAREVTLLPRHWEWLNRQPGGASVALRKLVEDARKANRDKDCVREAREAAYRFMSAMAGNEPGFEEAARALFGGSRERFELMAGGWPPDVREQAIRLAARTWQERG